MAKVWVVNHKNHFNYEKAVGFGNVQILTKGKVNIFKPDNLVADITNVLNKMSSEDDHVILCGYTFINTIVVHYFLKKYGKVKILIWNANDEKYEKITLYDFDV